MDVELKDRRFDDAPELRSKDSSTLKHRRISGIGTTGVKSDRYRIL